MLTFITNLLVRSMRLIAPKACAVCGCALAAGENVLCATCLSHLPRTRHWLRPHDNGLARLLWGRMAVERAAAWFRYEPQSEVSRVVYSFKYGNRPDHALHMGRMAAKELSRSGFFSGIDAIVPVPLARKRQRSRGYNQSREIAKGISGITGIPVVGGAVRRDTFTDSQTRMSRLQRIENVEHAFRLVKPRLLRGRHILIVDDIVTTGSTATALSATVATAGDVRVSVFALGLTRH